MFSFSFVLEVSDVIVIYIFHFQILMSMRISCEVIHRCFDQCITNLNSKRTTPEEVGDLRNFLAVSL